MILKRNTVTLIAKNIDPELLRKQRTSLVGIREETARNTQHATLSGIIHMMGAMLDRYDDDKNQSNDSISLNRLAPGGASGTLTGRCENPVIRVDEADFPEFKGKEVDPTGKKQHDVGAKMDQGKLRPALVLGAFAHALTAVTEVGTYGANKYTDNGWQAVPNGRTRYQDAAMRHLLKYLAGERINEEDGGVEHLAQAIWNLCAVYELER